MSEAKQVVRLNFNGTPIRDNGEFLSLTDMWRAVGAGDAKRPAEWLRHDATKEFASYLETVGSAHSLVRTQEGRAGGTWAHWQLALAYAKYLSPAFHAWCNDVVRAVMSGAAPVPVDHKALLADLLGTLVPLILDAVDKRIDSKLERLSVGTIRPWEAGAIKRRLLDAANESERLGMANAKSARKSFELRLRTACGWDGSGARIANMPVDRIGIADRELTAIERDLQRAADRADRQSLVRQPSLFDEKSDGKKKPN